MRAVVVVVGAGVALSGCGLDKANEQARQVDAIGDVRVTTVMCTSGDADGAGHACAAYDRSHRGQTLLGYRVPDGSRAPAALDDEADKLHFARSDAYTAFLESEYPEPGMHWTGYASQPFGVAAGTQGAFTVSPRLTLPDAGPRPFVGPFRYQVVGGYRELGDGEDGSAPVDCGAAFTQCLATGTPVPERDSLFATRDLGVLGTAGDAPTVVAGEHVAVPFDLPFAGPGGGDARFEFAATTDLPGAQVSLSRQSLEPPSEPDSVSRVVADVGVPADTAPGTYSVELVATGPSDGSVIIHKVPARRVAATGEVRRGTMTFRVLEAPVRDPEPEPEPEGEPEPERGTPTPPPPEPAVAAPPLQAPVQVPAAAVENPRARLRLSMSAMPRRAYTGEYASYLVEARNTSTEPARRARVCETLPRRVQFVSATRRAHFVGRRLCFDRTRLAAGGSFVALVYVHVDTDAPAGMARASASAAAANADRTRARARLRVLRRAAAPQRAPVTG